MIFSELYSAYYNTVAAILTRIVAGECSEKELHTIVTEHAFGESSLTILPSLKSEKWQLVHPDMTTALEYKPTMPLTNLQKQWLKAISLDPRMKLFDVSFPDLDGVTPLFTPADYYVYDQYSDGDPYESEEYIRQFRVILEAIRQKTPIKFEMTNRKGNAMLIRCYPIRLEYSEKDDKFRVITVSGRAVSTVNLARMRACQHSTGTNLPIAEERKAKCVTLTAKLCDDRNALERFMLHFAHFEKQAEKLGDKTYLVNIKYLQDDDAEMVIRILSFGPRVEVLGPESLKNLIIEKLKKQKSCGLR